MSKPHAPAFSGPQINIPESARGTANESTPADQRVPDRTTDLSDGPRTAEVFGGITTYLPARYEVSRPMKNERGEPMTHTIIREDR